MLVGVGVGRALKRLTKNLCSVNLGVFVTLAAFKSLLEIVTLLPENSPVYLGDSSSIVFVTKLPLGVPTVIV